MTEKEWLDIFSNNLARLLDENLMSQNDLSIETGISKGTVSKYVNGLQMPTVRALLAISYAFDESIDDLIDFGEVIEI